MSPFVARMTLSVNLVPASLVAAPQPPPPAEPLPARATARFGASLPHASGTFTPDGRRHLAAVNGVFWVWDVGTARATARYGVPAGVPGPSVERMLLARDGRTALLFVSEHANDRDATRRVVVWDVAANKPAREVAFDWWRGLPGPGDPPAVRNGPWVAGGEWAGSADGSELVGAGDDVWLVRLTDPPTGRRVGGPVPKSRGHSTPLVAHAGDRVVYASNEGAGAWDLATGRRLWSAPGPGLALSDPAASADGRWLAAALYRTDAGPDGGKGREPAGAAMWDTATGREVARLRELAPAGSAFTRFAPGPGGSELYGLEAELTSDAARVWRWPAGGGPPERVWAGRKSHRFAFSPGGQAVEVQFGLGLRRLDARTWRGEGPPDEAPPAVELWDAALLAEPPPGAGLPGGPLLVTADHDARVSAWEYPGGRLAGQWRLPARPDYSYATRLSPDGRAALVREYGRRGGAADAVVVGESFTRRTWRAAGSDRTAFSPDGRTVFVQVEEDAAAALDCRTGEEKRRLCVPSGYGLAASGDGGTLLSWGRQMAAADTATGGRRWSWSLSDRPWLPAPLDETAAPKRPVVVLPNFAAISPDGRRVAVLLEVFRGATFSAWHKGSVVALCDAGTGDLVWKHEAADYGSPVTPVGPEGHQLAFSPDGKTLAVGTWRVHLLDVGTGKETAVLDGHRGWLTALRFTPDGKRVLSASSDGTAVVWDVSAW